MPFVVVLGITTAFGAGTFMSFALATAAGFTTANFSVSGFLTSSFFAMGFIAVLTAFSEANIFATVFCVICFVRG